MGLGWWQCNSETFWAEVFSETLTTNMERTLTQPGLGCQGFDTGIVPDTGKICAGD